jgi:glycosyltransferase involved in cell wall biosynthesis
LEAKTKIDIVLPCFNPGPKWQNELSQFYKLSSDFYQLHFIVVNDGSTSSGIKEQIDWLNQQNIPITYYHYQTNKGKGHALRYGVNKATAPHVIYTDIDLPFTNQSMLLLLITLVKGKSDVVLGHRNDQYYKKKMSGFRKVLSLTFRFFLKKILRMPISDTQCGLKGFNQKGKTIFLQTKINRYLFDFEFIYNVCHTSGMLYEAVEVELKENVVFSKMKAKVLMQETVNLLYVLMKPSFKARK